MGKSFLYVLSVLVVLNLIYKSFIFFSYDKVPGKVIGFDGFNNKYERTSRLTGKKITSHEFVKTPLISFNIDDMKYHVTNEKWGYIDSFDKGDNVTVMANEKRDSFEVNTFFQFWITFDDIAWGFAICFVLTIFFGLIIPERKPMTWE